MAAEVPGLLYTQRADGVVGGVRIERRRHMRHDWPGSLEYSGKTRLVRGCWMWDYLRGRGLEFCDLLKFGLLCNKESGVSIYFDVMS